MSAKRGEAERGRDLAHQQIKQKDAERRHHLEARDQVAGAFLEARAFKRADGRQDQPHDAHIAVLVEGAAERRDDLDDIEAASEPGDDRRRRHHQQRIEPRREPCNDDHHPQQCQRHGCPSGTSSH
jgi:hypothetical protein